MDKGCRYVTNRWITCKGYDSQDPKCTNKRLSKRCLDYKALRFAELEIRSRKGFCRCFEKIAFWLSNPSDPNTNISIIRDESQDQ